MWMTPFLNQSPQKNQQQTEFDILLMNSRSNTKHCDRGRKIRACQQFLDRSPYEMMNDLQPVTMSEYSSNIFYTRCNSVADMIASDINYHNCCCKPLKKWQNNVCSKFAFHKRTIDCNFVFNQFLNSNLVVIKSNNRIY